MKRRPKFIRMMRAADAVAWEMILFGVGVLAGVMLVVMVPGMPWSSSVRSDVASLDLEAQRSMAAAAWFMVVLSGTGTALGIASIWLLRLNLIEARRVTAEAARSAAAAEEAVRATNRAAAETATISRTQVRAYIVAMTPQIEFTPEGTTRASCLAYNAGQSPAFAVSSRVRLAVWHEDKRVYSKQSNFTHLPAVRSNDGVQTASEFDYYPPHDVDKLDVLVEFIFEFVDVFRDTQVDSSTSQVQFPLKDNVPGQSVPLQPYPGSLA